MFDLLIRPPLMSALVALITYVATTTLAADTTQVWIIAAGIIVVSGTYIVSSTSDRYAFLQPYRPSDWLSPFEYVVRPIMLMAPVSMVAWSVHVGIWERLGIGPDLAGVTIAYGMLAIAVSVHRRRYRGAW